MRIQMIVHAALLSLGLGLPAWASSRILPPRPVSGMEALPGNGSPPERVMAPAAPRGQMLYENHCMACHESLVHIGERKQVKSLPQLRARVQYWASYLQMRWDGEEVDEVVKHLDSTYYRFERR